MKKKGFIFINFPLNGGVRQFSESLIRYLKEDVDFVDLSGSWRNRVRLIKYRNDNIIFGNNNFWIYLFIIFMKGKISIILHDHKIRSGASKKERLNLWLFNFFIGRFEQVIIHTKHDDEARELLKRNNVVYEIMPPHGFPSKFIEENTCDKNFRNNILCFGRIEDYKNFDYIAEAISTCPNTKLTIAGSGHVSKALETIISDNSNINLINKYIDDDELISLINRNQYIALPYKDITQTGIIELAGYFRKPIITSNIQHFLNYKPNDFQKIIPIDNLHDCRIILKELENLNCEEYASMCRNSHGNFNDKMELWTDYVDALKISL